MVIKFFFVEDVNYIEKDGRWVWVVCVVVFCDLFVVMGMYYFVGVLYVVLFDYFKELKVKIGK